MMPKKIVRPTAEKYIRRDTVPESAGQHNIKLQIF